MIIRIVKIGFKPQSIVTFKALFENQKAKIRAFDGCSHLELLQDKNNPETFMTYSFWESEEALNKYRESELFKGIWADTKVHFNAKPEAWSLNQLHKID